MSKTLLERRLSANSLRLKSLRQELAVVDEQLACLVEMADDTRIRALVSETPLSGREHEEAQRHADAMARQRADVVRRMAVAERLQDDLLDRLTARTG